MNDVSPGKLTTIISAVVVFGCGFLPWFSAGSGSFSVSVNAWGEGFFPVATWAPVFAVVTGLLVGLPAFTQVKLPEKILDFTIEQLALVSTFIVLLITFGYAIASPGGLSMGFGLILSLLGAIGMAVGFVLDKQGIGVSTNQGAGAPGGYPQYGQPQQQAPGYAPQPGQPQPQPPAPGYAPQPGQPQPPAPGYAPQPGQQPPQQPGGSF